MCKRTLLVTDWRGLTGTQLTYIQQLTAECDELIILLEEADLYPENPAPCMGGDFMVQLRRLLHTHINIPLYILPVPTRGATPLYSWLKWRVVCPAFQQVYTSRINHIQAMQTALRVPVHPLPAATGNTVNWPIIHSNQPVRALFVARAQPLHNGHVACLKQILQEVEEVVVVIAMAERSHQPTNIATGGERLAMLLPVLHQLAPAKHYLAAFPYSDYYMENLYELECLLPTFQYVYTTNPGTIAMATTGNYPVRGFNTGLPVSSTLIRECMLQNLPYQEYVPPSVFQQLQQMDIAQRLQQITAKEKER